MDIFPCPSAPLSDYVAETWECDAQSGLETNPRNNPYYLFVMREEYKYI
jgi:hypothetical protein